MKVTFLLYGLQLDILHNYPEFNYKTVNICLVAEPEFSTLPVAQIHFI